MKALLLTALALPASAQMVWKAPEKLPMGQLSVLELRETDPTKPAPGRPAVDETLGALPLRSLEPLADGRGWRFTVQPLKPGRLKVPVLDLGQGQQSPELVVQVPRTVAFGSDWKGVGGGPHDLPDDLPFPWGWTLLVLSPLGALGYWGFRRWRSGTPKRRLARMGHRFRTHWPPLDRKRTTLDEVHGLGRSLLEARFGNAGLAWGPRDLRVKGLHTWAQWVESLDAARFGRSQPPFPAIEALLKELGP